MIGNVMSGLQTNYSLFPVTRKTESTENSFDEILTETTGDYLLDNAPDKWVTEVGCSVDAVKAAMEYKKNVLGITDTEEPTHELTTEQRDWLYSRYDFSAMRTHVVYSYTPEHGPTQTSVKSTAEYSNFLADLAYLGVYSAQELMYQVAPLDTRAGSDSTLTEYFFSIIGNSNRTLRDTARAIVSHLENMFNFYDQRSKDPLRAIEGDDKFAALIKEQYLPFHEQYFKFIDELIGNEIEELPQNTTVPPIEDISAKLKEDFGKVLA